MQTFQDSAQTIRVSAGETFAIRLAANPSTGYTWHADVDARCLKQVGQQFEPAGKGVGAGGYEACSFRALAPCETEIRFEYRRPWGGEARDIQRFEVLVT
jgi:predicted secreted protein